MATVGQQLLQPESGWKRYDDTDTRFAYRGFDTHMEDSQSYNKTYAGAISAENPEIEFTFVGSKIRIITTVASGYSQDVQIIIDGNVESFSAHRSSMQRQTLVYHKEGLEFKEHHVLIRTNTPASNVAVYDYRFDAIDIDDTGYLTPVVIGEEILLHPMNGWKRYNDNHPAIKYQEGKWKYVQEVNNYNGDFTGAYKNTESEAEFCFVGKGLSLAGLQGFGYADNVEVYIDGEFKGTAKVYHPVNRPNRLLYLIDDLEDTKHHVVIKVRIKTPNPDAVTYDMRLDTIDILSDREDGGVLLHPDEVTDINDLEVGKRIRCHYSATSNQVGVFSNLGKEVYVDGINDFIPPTSSATPNGCFYYIMVDRDRKGDPVLVADRNIQHSISWDRINEAGAVNGVEVSLEGLDPTTPNVTVSNKGTTVRATTSVREYIVVKSMNPKNSGKWYFEVEVDEYKYNIGIGVCSEDTKHNSIGSTITNAKDQRFLLNNSSQELVFVGEGGQKNIIKNSQLSVGDIISVMVDLDEGIVSYKLNGVDLPYILGEVEKLGSVVAMVTFHNFEVGSQVTVNFGDKGFKYGLPSGFRPWYELQDKYNFEVRLLTGGISSSDKDNEWDKYIVESDLNGTITPGDNDVWNWGNVDGTGNSSWTSTTPEGTNSANKVNRGQGATSNLIGWYNGSPTRVNNWLGFRPVITIERLPTNSILLRHGTKMIEEYDIGFVIENKSSDIHELIIESDFDYVLDKILVNVDDENDKSDLLISDTLEPFKNLTSLEFTDEGGIERRDKFKLYVKVTTEKGVRGVNEFTLRLGAIPKIY